MVNTFDKLPVKDLTITGASAFGYGGTSVSEGIIAYYPFSEDGNTIVKDHSGYENHCLSFSGNAMVSSGVLTIDKTTNDNVVCPASPVTAATTITVSAWVKLIQDTDNTAIWLSRGGYNADGWYLWGSRSDGVPYVTLNRAGANIGPTGGLTSFYDNDVWTHVVIMFDQSNIKDFRNGREVGSQVLSANWITSDTRTLFIGDYNGGGYDVSGSIDDILIYDRLLSDEEVRQIFDAGRSS